MATVISSSPATETINNTSAHAFTFAIPSGTWATALWTLVQTTGERLDRSTFAFTGGWIGWSNSVSNTQTDVGGAPDLAAINSAAGGLLTVTVTMYNSDLSLGMTAFTLTLTSANVRRRCSITYRGQ